MKPISQWKNRIDGILRLPTRLPRRLPGLPGRGETHPEEEPSPVLLQEKAVRTVRVILVCGAVVLLLDLFLCASAGTISIHQENGHLWLARPGADEPAGHLSLKARVRGTDGVVEKDLDLRLSPWRDKDAPDRDDDLPEETISEEDRILTDLRGIVSDLDRDRSARQVLLPRTTPGGEPIQWLTRRSGHTLMILTVTGLSAMLVYRRRQMPLRKIREAQRQSILRRLPGFLNQLVLLMNAGLGIHRAVERTVEEAMRFDAARTDYFYRRMNDICASIRNTNGSLAAELRAFARISGVPELMRVSSILYDNINRGSALNEKLELEADALWTARKLHSEEQGRLAETKMTLPLTVFLCVLIIITVTPALLTL